MSATGAFGQPLLPDWVKCPTCPQCGAPPAFVGVLPWFCSDDQCKTLTWNPEVDVDANLMAIQHLHDPTVCPLGGQVVTDGNDPRCRCYPDRAS